MQHLLTSLAIFCLQEDSALLCPSLQAMVALTEFNPDIITSEGYRVLLQLLEVWSSRLEEPAVPEYLVSGVVSLTSRSSLYLAGLSLLFVYLFALSLSLSLSLSPLKLVHFILFFWPQSVILSVEVCVHTILKPSEHTYSKNVLTQS